MKHTPTQTVAICGRGWTHRNLTTLEEHVCNVPLESGPSHRCVCACDQRYLGRPDRIEDINPVHAGWREDSALAAEVHLRHHWMHRAQRAEAILRELANAEQHETNLSRLAVS